MTQPITVGRLLRRLRWDIMDPGERRNLVYYFMQYVPGEFGDQLRSRFLCKHMKRAGVNVRIMAGSRFRSIEKLEVGDNVSIGFDNFLQAKGGLTIGDNVLLGPSVKIWTTNHNYSNPDVPIRLQGHTNTPVTIGEDVFIASNAFILPGANIGRGSVVSAGAVVNGKAYPPYAILGGNPARVIGYRGGRNEAQVEQRAEAAPGGDAPSMVAR